MNVPTIRPSRRSTLRSSLIGGAAVCASTGLAVSGANATSQPRPSAKTARPTLPAAWQNTVFTAKLPDETQGYIASHGTLFGYGAVVSLSARELRDTEALGSFIPDGDSEMTETFDPHITEGAAVDAASTAFTFMGSNGREIPAHVQLLRTANPKRRALLLWVDGENDLTRRIPKKTRVVGDLARIDTPQQMTADMAKELLRDALVYSFTEEAGAKVNVNFDQVQILDGGRHVSVQVSGTINDVPVDGTWCGAAQSHCSGWYYLFGKLPA